MKFPSSFTLAVSSAFAISSTFAQLQPCNLAQVAGTSELFTISGGNGTFAPNSTQSIVYDRPEGAPVRRIRANVTIVDLDDDNSFTPPDVSGVPVEFLTNETNTHISGVIGVTLPDDIPESDNYVFRVTIRSRGSLCYLDTAPFSVQGDIVETCTPGAFMCSDDFTGFLQCKETDANSTSFAFVDEGTCALTTVCSQVNETVIACIPPPVVDECTLGTFECVEPDSSRECILDPETGGTVWSDPVPCAVGFSCNDATGVCEADVVDECVLGTAECVTETSNRVCITDSETGGTVWSDPAECPAGTTCNEETGLCTSGVPNGDECLPRSQICLSDTTFDECIQNENGIWSLGGVTLNCPPDSTCTPYFNNTINCAPDATLTSLRKRSLRFSRNLF